MLTWRGFLTQRYLFHENTGVKLRLFMTKYNASLRQIIRQKRTEVDAGRQKPFTPLEVANIMIDIASGLEFLHKVRPSGHLRLSRHRRRKPNTYLVGGLVRIRRIR
jgi:serine/threonine protein kinase